jgi:chitinase
VKSIPFQHGRVLPVLASLIFIATFFGAPLAAYAWATAPKLAVGTSFGTCNLSWTSISGATGYDIYRDGNWYKYVTATSYADTGLANGANYRYAIDARNDTTSPNKVSPKSRAVSCTPAHSLATPVLSVGASNQACNLAWNVIGGANGYDVYRNGAWYQYTTSASLADTGLTNGTAYIYTVDAQNSTTSPLVVSAQSTSRSCTPSSSAAAYEIVGYYPGWTSGTFPVNSANINANNLTVINYAFLNICWNGKQGNPDSSINDVIACQNSAPNGAIVLGDYTADPTNLANLVALKSVNPKLKVVPSVGGWSWSNQFSNMAASSTTRANFISSAVALVRKYGLDGLDIDWEYPTSVGVPCTSGNTCQRSTDKQNFVTLVQELRSAFDSAGATDGKHYSITVAAGADQSYVFDPNGSSAWIVSLANTLDWVNVMTYDYHGTWESRSGHVAPLYRDPTDTSADGAVRYGDYSITLLLNQGIPASKLVLGEPFYGYGWAGCAAGTLHGLYQTCSGPATGSQGSTFDFAWLTAKGYLTKDSSGTYTVGGNGFTRYWNSSARVPYLYNATSKVFITYEDEASIHEKGNYIIGKGLRGGMFWELNADRGMVLGNVIANDLAH